MEQVAFSLSEQKDKKYTVQDALNAAALRCNGKPICLNSVKNMRRDEKITLVKLNEIADRVVDDTRYYG